MHPETGLVIAVKVTEATLGKGCWPQEVYIDVQRTPDEKLKALK